jgi:hypothetical protein
LGFTVTLKPVAGFKAHLSLYSKYFLSLQEFCFRMHPHWLL